MEEHAGEGVGLAIAAEVRAELAVQRRTAHDLALALGVTAHTIGRRLSGASPFNVIEMALAAHWLGMTPDVLVRRAEERLARAEEAVAS
jgi:hypothetical protein